MYKNDQEERYYLKRAFLLFLFLFFCINIGYSQNNKNPLRNASDIEVSIRFYNKQIYTLGKPIIVEFQIHNSGSEPYVFLASYNKVFTFDFEVYTTSHRMIEHSHYYMIKRTNPEPILNDEITLKPDEVYGVRIDISEWFDLKAPAELIIKGVFYPGLITNPEERLYSENELFLSLRPAYTEEVRKKEERETIEKLKAQKLPPYEVIEFMLRALMEKDFEKYFLYIRFERFIQQFSNAWKKYSAAPDVDKPKVIEEFKEYLMGKNRLEGIPFSDHIPIDFEIIETIIQKSDAVVTVEETFKFGFLIEKREYKYRLHKYGDKWFLESYRVRIVNE